MYCVCCGTELKERDKRFKDILSSIEQKRLAKLHIGSNCCDRCQTDILLLTALS